MRNLRSPAHAAAAALAAAAFVVSPARAGAQPVFLEGEVQRGDAWQAGLGAGTRVELLPIEHGWRVRLGPADEAGRDWIVLEPRHLVPPTSLIEGWHFRNADNTAPNDVGAKNVNAPGRERILRFGRRTPVLAERAADADAVQAAVEGEVRLRITALELGGVEPGGRAHIERMAFTLEVRCLRGACLEEAAPGR